MKSIQRRLFCFLFVLLIAPWLAVDCNAETFIVQFSGHVTESDDARDNSSTAPFDKFQIGVPFSGSFRFDSNLIIAHIPYTLIGSGTLDWYRSPVRDFQVQYDFGNESYRYDGRPNSSPASGAPPFDLDDGGSYTWRIGDNVDNYRDEISLRLENYPSAWNTGVPAGPTLPVPASEYVDGLYPHASFFELSDFGPKTMVTSPQPVVDLEAAFAQSTLSTFTLRFTDPSLPSWQAGMESLLGVVHGDITSLSVHAVPEPHGAALLLTALSSLALVSRRG